MSTSLRKSVALSALCLAAAFAVAEGAHAQAAAPKKDAAAVATKSDKSMATKKGAKDSLGSKDIDANKLPGKFEMGLAFGSVAAMIAAIKYL